jgi:aminomethyltransferase
MEKRLENNSHTKLYFGTWNRKSPFFKSTQKYGAKAYDIYCHMYLPIYYDDPIKEYWALINDVTLWDVSVERIVEITGPDASEFTNSLTCRDLSKCAVGQGKYMLVTSPNGGIVNDPVLLRLGENQWWMALANNDAGLYALGAAINSGLKVKVIEPEVYPLQVQGPKSLKVMKLLFGDKILQVRYYWTLETDLDGIPVVISRTGWTGEMGYEIYLRDPSRGNELWERIMEAGKPYNIRPIAPCEARKIEAGIMNHGQSMNIENNPYEITGFERLVEDQSSDYIGKKALKKIKDEGVKKRLVGIKVELERTALWMEDAWPVYKEGKQIGKITDLAWSPRLKQNIGYVWVPTSFSEPGVELEIQSTDGKLKGVVTKIPFIDPEKKVPSQNII